MVGLGAVDLLVALLTRFGAFCKGPLDVGDFPEGRPGPPRCTACLTVGGLAMLDAAFEEDDFLFPL